MARAAVASQGVDAQLHITRHIGELMASGDMLAVSVWREVRRAVAALQQEVRSGAHPEPSRPESG